MADLIQARLAEAGVRLAFGLLPLAVAGRPTEAAAIRTIRAAIDAGVVLIDTADIYGLDNEAFGYTESLLALAIKKVSGSNRPLIATKGGLIRMPDGSRRPRGDPAYLMQACHRSRKRLEVESIDLYQLHRPDPGVPFAESVGALRDLLDGGWIRSAGVSNVSATQIDSARSILGNGLVAIQNKFSVEDRRDTQGLSTSALYGLAYLAWGPLGGIGQGQALGRRLPALRRVAARHGVSPHRVALAWLLAHKRHMVPVVGTRVPAHLADAVAATLLILTAEDMRDITEAESSSEQDLLAETNIRPRPPTARPPL